MKKILQVTFAVLMLITLGGETFAASSFPNAPQLSVTPGKLCDRPQSYRYPEKIAYCGRDVSFETKESLITEYDQKFGYSIQSMTRADFKIDHFIPLCAGGSNDVDNLWPQHKTVYVITDPLEPVLCEKMALGRLKQSDAVNLVIEAKTNLSRTRAIIQYVSRL